MWDSENPYKGISEARKNWLSDDYSLCAILNCKVQDTQKLPVKANKHIQEMMLTLRNLSKAPLVSNVSFPTSSIVTAASLARVTPQENGCPGLLRG